MRIHNGLKIAAVYTAVVLGAGFASGQELMQYFVGYGASGLWGLVIAGVVFALTGWAVLDIMRLEKIKDYASLMAHLLGKRLGFAAELAVAAFLCVLYATMLAAAGATVQQVFGLPFTAGVLIAGVLCFLVLLFDLNGIVRVSAVLAPFMVVGGVFVGLYAFFNHTVTTFYNDKVVPSWVLSAVVYASYNIVIGIPVLAALSGLATRKKDCRIGGVLGGAAMTVLGLSMALPLYLYHAKIIAVEIPFLVIVMGYGDLITTLYLVIMLCAIFTTAISNGFAFAEWVCARRRVDKKMLCLALTVAAVPAAHAGFSNFVGYAYPAFGLLGFFVIVVVLLNWRRTVARSRPAHAESD